MTDEAKKILYYISSACNQAGADLVDSPKVEFDSDESVYRVSFHTETDDPDVDSLVDDYVCEQLNVLELGSSGHFHNYEVCGFCIERSAT